MVGCACCLCPHVFSSCPTPHCVLLFPSAAAGLVQTHCALSGEQFEQFWDEEHQEWRYRGAKALDAEEAARSVQCFATMLVYLVVGAGAK